MADAQGNEAQFRRDLVSLLKEQLGEELPRRKLCIGENVKVLYDITATVEIGRFEPRLGFLEQDIVFINTATVDPKLALYFRNTTEFAKICVPRLVIETKYKGISSHALMTYSNIAMRIKGIFAHAKYYLLLRYDDKSAETLLRHGIGFDRIIQLETIKGTAQINRYVPGEFKHDLASNRGLCSRFDRLIQTIRADFVDEKLIV